jgi:hypothetical protein
MTTAGLGDVAAVLAPDVGEAVTLNIPRNRP